MNREDAIRDIMRNYEAHLVEWRAGKCKLIHPLSFMVQGMIDHAVSEALMKFMEVNKPEFDAVAAKLH